MGWSWVCDLDMWFGLVYIRGGGNMMNLLEVWYYLIFW